MNRRPEPVWRNAVRRFLPPGPRPGLNRFYARMGWSKGDLCTYTVTPDVRVSVLVAMADALEIPRSRFFRVFLEEAVRAESMPPEGPRARQRKRGLDSPTTEAL